MQQSRANIGEAFTDANGFFSIEVPSAKVPSGKEVQLRSPAIPGRVLQKIETTGNGMLANMVTGEPSKIDLPSNVQILKIRYTTTRTTQTTKTATPIPKCTVQAQFFWGGFCESGACLPHINSLYVLSTQMPTRMEGSTLEILRSPACPSTSSMSTVLRTETLASVPIPLFGVPT